MPWGPIAVAAIGAGASIWSAKKQAGSVDKATEAQTKANDEALAYAKEQEARKRADWERAYAEWEAGRNALLSRYDVSLPGATRSYTPAPSVASNPAVAHAANMRQSQTVADFLWNREAADKPWNDWERYGLPQA